MLRNLKDCIRIIRILIIRLISSFRKKFNSDDIQAKALIVAPHPDDEIIGCAGLLRSLLQNGKQVDIILMTGGGASHHGCCDIDEKTLINARRQLTKDAAQIIGLSADRIHFLDYPDGCISKDNPETEKLSELIKDLSPDAIFVPNKGEGWSDHIVTGEIVRNIIKDNESISLYEYCVWFWYYNYWAIDWEQARVLKMTKQQAKTKNLAIDAYIHPAAPCGKPYSGVLPSVFIWANSWDKELYFKVK